MVFLEVTLFSVAVIGVIALGIWKSKAGEKSDSDGEASDYFLAGRGLTWWLVGFSLIAANISTEQFVGMSGAAAGRQGLAVASWEWVAAITLVVVAFWFLPKFLKCGIYTIPEFLEHRFDGFARLAMSIPAILTLIFVNTATVIYSGAKFVSEYYNEVPVLGDLTTMCWIIATLAAVYVFVGGLKACAWTDLVWGASLIVGGGIVMFLAFNTLAEKPAEELILTKVANSNATVEDIEQAGAWERFKLLNDGVDGEAAAVVGENGDGGKLHMVRPADDPDMPWTALLIGIWIPNFFYWGLNQFIVQRTLGSKSLAEGQKGIVFAAFMKLLIPFLVVFPGILAFNLFSEDLFNAVTGEYDYDAAFPVLVRNLIQPTPMISWFILAALLGAVISSLASMLNSASTMTTMDLYAKFTKEKDAKKLVKVGKGLVLVFVLLAVLVAPSLDKFDSIFAFIQEFQGFISPGILSVFLFGFFSPKTPRYFGVVGILSSVAVYGGLLLFAGDIAFLNRMAITVFSVIVIGIILTIVRPMAEPVKMPVNDQIELESSPVAKMFGVGVVIATIALYAVFW
ncbi:MAG: sodium:solute symporter family transporter [Opitutales bacterium]